MSDDGYENSGDGQTDGSGNYDVFNENSTYSYDNPQEYFTSYEGQQAILQNQLFNAINSIALNYSNIRPFMPTPVYVYFLAVKTLGLSSNGILAMTYLTLFQWPDPRLMWNTTTYPFETLNLPVENVWFPEISVLNSASANQAVTPGSSPMVTIDNTGTVSMVSLTETDSTCTLSLMYFPYDSQMCKIQFVSFDNNGTAPGITFEPQTVSNIFQSYSQTGEFQLTNYNTSAAKALCISGTCFNRITVYLYYTRRYSYYMITLIIPICVLTVLLAMAIIIPSENVVKITLACTLMVSLYTLQQTVGRLLPASDKAPLLSIGMAASLCLACYSALSAIVMVILKIHLPRIRPGLLDLLLKVPLFGGGDRSRNAVEDSMALEKRVSEFTVVKDSLRSLKDDDLVSASDRLLYSIAALLKDLVQHKNDKKAAAKEAELKRKNDMLQVRGWKILDLIINVVLMTIFIVVSIVFIVLFDT